MEVNEVIETLGYDSKDFKTIEDFKGKVESDWIRRDAVDKDAELQSKIAGKSFAPVEVNLKRFAKEKGVILEDGEVKGKKLSELQEIVINKLDESYKARLTDAERKSGLGNDEKVKAAEQRAADWEKKFGDLKGIHDTTSQEFERFKTDTAGKEKTFKIKTIYDKAMSIIKWKSGITDLERAGFNTVLAQNYKFEVDEKDAFIVRGQDDKIITSKKVAGQAASIDEILELEADKNNLIQKNPLKTGFQFQGQKVDSPKELTDDQAVVVGGRLRKMNTNGREAYAGRS